MLPSRSRTGSAERDDVGQLAHRRPTGLDQRQGVSVAIATDVADKIDRNLFERYGDVQAFGVTRSCN